MSAAHARLDVGVVGAGDVGITIAQALAGAGHRIRAASTSSAQNRERLETLLPGVPIVDEAQVIERSELVVLSIPEGDLAAFAEGTARAGVWHPGQLALHTAPGFGQQVLDPLARIGVIPLAISPTIAFSGTSIDVKRLLDAPIVVSAAPAVLPIAQALAIEMGGEPIEIEDAQRPVYAEARDVARGFSSAIVEQAARLLRDIGITEPAALLRSVLTTSVDDALAQIDRPDAPEARRDER